MPPAWSCPKWAASSARRSAAAPAASSGPPPGGGSAAGSSSRPCRRRTASSRSPARSCAPRRTPPALPRATGRCPRRRPPPRPSSRRPVATSPAWSRSSLAATWRAAVRPGAGCARADASSSTAHERHEHRTAPSRHRRSQPMSVHESFEWEQPELHESYEWEQPELHESYEWEQPETFESHELSGELHEGLELELAQELLEITNEAELEEFLGKLVRGVARGASSFMKSSVGRAVGGVLRSVARAMRAPYGVPPRTVARSAAVSSARRYAPTLLRPTSGRRSQWRSRRAPGWNAPAWEPGGYRQAHTCSCGA